MRTRLLGVDVILHWSLLILAVLIPMSVSKAVQSKLGLGLEMSIIFGLLCAVFLILSVLFHEFAHILAGRRFGIRFSTVTLFILGGAARMEDDPPTSSSEFWMALAGPLSSLALGGAGIGLAFLLTNEFFILLLSYLSSLNIMLFVFNLLPLLPFDGGRVLRAGLWRFLGYQKATLISGNIGRAGALLFCAAGVFAVLGHKIPYFGSGTLTGFMMLIMGNFIYNSVSAELKAHKLNTRARFYLRLLAQYKSLDENSAEAGALADRMDNLWLSMTKSEIDTLNEYFN